MIETYPVVRFTVSCFFFLRRRAKHAWQCLAFYHCIYILLLVKLDFRGGAAEEDPCAPPLAMGEVGLYWGEAGLYCGDVGLY